MVKISQNICSEYVIRNMYFRMFFHQEHTNNGSSTGSRQQKQNNDDHFGDFFLTQGLRSSRLQQMTESHVQWATWPTFFPQATDQRTSMNIKQQKQVPRHCSGWIHPSPSPETMACRTRPISWK